jgi:hypothetical protein
MAISLTQRIHWDYRSIEIQPFNLSIDQSALSYLDSFATERDFIGFGNWDQAVRNNGEFRRRT